VLGRGSTARWDLWKRSVVRFARCRCRAMIEVPRAALTPEPWTRTGLRLMRPAALPPVGRLAADHRDAVEATARPLVGSPYACNQRWVQRSVALMRPHRGRSACTAKIKGNISALEIVILTNRMVPDLDLVFGGSEPQAGWLGCAFGALGAGATCAAGTLCTGGTGGACAIVAATACFAASGSATCNCTGEC
jgi:hypothetical protein